MSKTFEELSNFLEAKVNELKAGNAAKRNVHRYNFSLFPASMVFAILWGMGIVVTKGFWATLFAILVPFVGPAQGVIWLIERFTGA